MKPKFKMSTQRFLVSGLVLLVTFVALAQGDWSLGKYRFTSGQPSGPLQYSLASSGGLGSYGFVSGVGGVAFNVVAVPSAALKEKGVVPHYAKEMTDGHRLRVLVGDEAVEAALPDWMLVPIVKYADSPFDACVSLFGLNTNDTVYDIVYHESFRNTLLGLRLLQADMLLFDIEETWRLPQRNGIVVLGFGETAPRGLDQRNAEIIESALSDGSFQSWVMTDQNEEVLFSVRGGHLELTGAPYYYFWTSNVEAVQAEQARLEAQALELLRAGRVADHNRIVEKANALEPAVKEVRSLTQKLKGARRALQQFNPPVYDAATQTMRYSAFLSLCEEPKPRNVEEVPGGNVNCKS